MGAELIIDLVLKGFGGLAEVIALAQRVKNGETITNEEIEALKLERHEAAKAWDAVQGKDQLGIGV